MNCLQKPCRWIVLSVNRLVPDGNWHQGSWICEHEGKAYVSVFQSNFTEMAKDYKGLTENRPTINPKWQDARQLVRSTTFPFLAYTWPQTDILSIKGNCELYQYLGRVTTEVLNVFFTRNTCLIGKTSAYVTLFDLSVFRVRAAVCFPSEGFWLDKNHMFPKSGTRQLTDKTIHRHGFWRHRIEDRSPTKPKSPSTIFAFI